MGEGGKKARRHRDAAEAAELGVEPQAAADSYTLCLNQCHWLFSSATILVYSLQVIFLQSLCLLVSSFFCLLTLGPCANMASGPEGTLPQEDTLRQVHLIG